MKAWSSIYCYLHALLGRVSVATSMYTYLPHFLQLCDEAVGGLQCSRLSEANHKSYTKVYVVLHP